MIKKPAIVTSLSIAGIVLAGGAAVGANVGILSAADESPIGELSAEANLATTQVPTTAPTTTATPKTEVVPQRFAVENAGYAEVLREGNTITFGKLLPEPGWLAVPGEVAPTRLEAIFGSGDDRLTFTATLAEDGTISAAVNRPGSASAAAAATPSGGAAAAAPATAAQSPTQAASPAPAATSSGTAAASAPAATAATRQTAPAPRPVAATQPTAAAGRGWDDDDAYDDHEDEEDHEDEDHEDEHEDEHEADDDD